MLVVEEHGSDVAVVGYGKHNPALAVERQHAGAVSEEHAPVGSLGNAPVLRAVVVDVAVEVSHRQLLGVGFLAAGAHEKHCTNEAFI